jgi:hypothetical protein
MDIQSKVSIIELSTDDCQEVNGGFVSTLKQPLAWTLIDWLLY